LRRREFFHIRKFARRYDRSTGKFVISIAYQTATEVTPRTIAVAEAFGLGIDEKQKFVVYDDVELKIGSRDVVYITGDSGSGKSPYDRDVQAELNVEQWEQSKGSEVYTFSHPEGSHDDKFWAIALAVMAAVKGAEESRLVRAY